MNMPSAGVPGQDAESIVALKKIIEESRHTRFGTAPLDLRKPHHLLHATRTFIGPDANKPLFPALTASLERTRLAHEAEGGPKPFTLFEQNNPATNVFQAAAKILYCDIVPSTNTAITGAVITLLEVAQSVQATLQIVDVNTDKIVAQQQFPITPNTYSTLVTVQAVVSQPWNFTAVLSVAIQPVGGGTSVALTDTCMYSGSEPVASMVATDPRSKQTPPRNYVKIALNRTSANQPDCDYYYSYGNTGPQPIVGLAVTGNAQLTTTPPYTLAAQPGFNGYLYLFRRDSLVGGGACIVLPPQTDMTQYVRPAGTSFTWNLPTDTFQGAPWDQNQTIDMDFFMEFSVQQGGGPAGLGRIRATSIPQVYTGPSAPPNVFPVPPLTFVWGCLRGGTKVRTPAGERAIETLEVGDEVYGADGVQRLPVTNTWKGWETRPLVRIVDEAGRCAEMTELHPVATDTGLVAARSLERGMEVKVAGGTLATLVKVEQVPFEGHVYNVDLGEGDEGQGEEGRHAMLIANGFVVGDNRAQGDLSAQLLSSQKHRSSEIPAGWALDIENSRRRAEGLPLRVA